MGVLGGKWADLPVEILDGMLAELSDVEDFIRFGGVCRSWRCASVDKNFDPWLMLSEPEHPHNFLEDATVMLINMFDQAEEKDKGDLLPRRRFFNLCTKKTVELCLPEAQGRRCWGSNFGWLFAIGLDLNIHLLNPLTRHQITLPPQPTFPKQYGGHVEAKDVRTIFVEKFALSSHPKGNNKHHQEKQERLVVMVINSEGQTLGMCRQGDKAWTDVMGRLGPYEDVLFYNNLFYAVHHEGDLFVCDITTPEPVATVFMPPPLWLPYSYRYYLLEMSGDLHMIVRMYHEEENLVTDYYS